MLPVLFKIGNFPIHSYGVMIVLAFFAALWLARSRAQRYGFTPAQISDVSFWALIAGILGARIVFILQELPYYLKHLNELFSLQFQGLTSFGGLIFGFVVVVVWCVRNHVSLVRMMDVMAPAFLLGHAIGRVGCLLNGCCFGGVCPPSVPWGIHVPYSTLLHHPAQMYDSFMNLAALGAILLIERKRLFAGQVAGAFFVLHGLTRFIYEFWRAGTQDQVDRNEASSTYWGSPIQTSWGPVGITQAQAMAAVLILIGAVMWVVFAKKRQPALVESTPSSSAPKGVQPA